MLSWYNTFINTLLSVFQIMKIYKSKKCTQNNVK